MRDATKCLHSGYTPKCGEPGVMPIVQSTTYVFETQQQIADQFNMPTAHIYSRLSNPTVAAVEAKIADIEGGVGAMCTSSGQSATLLSVLNLCKSGDSIISTAAIYGGTVNLFSKNLPKYGIECIYVDVDADEETLNKAFKSNTKLVFGETLSNPSLSVLDFEKFSKVAHAHGVPLIVDNTFATPMLCKPFEFGADIVVHSTSKYLDGHALQIGGVIVDGGKFDWTNGKFPEFTEPDDSYHGMVFSREFKEAAFIIKARLQFMRDFGCCMAPNSAFLLNLGIETLPLRMKAYCESALAVATAFEQSDKVEAVGYPALASNKYYPLSQKYLKNGSSGVMSVTFKGGKDAAAKFIDSLTLASNEVHVADIRTCVLHPATATHRQLSEQQLAAAGINPGLIRFSVGLEDVSDILEDIKSSLDKI